MTILSGIIYEIEEIQKIYLDINNYSDPHNKPITFKKTKFFTTTGFHFSKTIESFNYFVSFVGEAIKLKNHQEYDLLIVDYDPLMENTEVEDETGWNCSVHPSVFFLLGMRQSHESKKLVVNIDSMDCAFPCQLSMPEIMKLCVNQLDCGTLILTTCATGMLCAAIMTDHWEEVTWDKSDLETLANSTVKLQWLLDNKVAKVSTNDIKDRSLAFFVPMHGGIWTLCVSLTAEELSLLGQVGFPSVQPCVNYLSGGIDGVRGFEPRADWQHRMQNLSISCALVCLIVLGSAALVGAFGIFHHQISAVLVTGVMYLLAASFALFTLTIIHFKRLHSKPYTDETDITPDGVVSPIGAKGIRQLLQARVFTTSWSLDLGWGGVMLCVMTSVLWILLSKIMRFNPISSMLSY